MSYFAAIDQLNHMTPELAGKPGEPRRKFSIEQVRILMQALGSPHRAFPAVLIAGTNGKGSTASTLASILTASGQRTGLYTSPHLSRPNERVRIDRTEIADDDFARLYFRVHDAGQQLVLDGALPQLPSYFEILTALGFLYFAERQVQIAVLEVGMGGRLDATNVVDPLLSVITDISLDHMEWLGSTIGAIAREKAGILRPGGTMVTLPQHPEANQALGEVATELCVRGVNAAVYMPPSRTQSGGAYQVEALGRAVTVDSPLHGDHQYRNLALAIAAAVELAQRHSFPVTPASIAEGIRLTHWPGRLESITTPADAASQESAHTQWILDVAHNPAGAWALRASLNSLPKSCSTRLVFSCLRDKPLAEMSQILFPLFDEVIVVPIHSPRATPLAELVAAAQAAGVPVRPAQSPGEAIALARQAAPGGTVVVSGSVYLVGEVRALLLAGTEKP